MIFELNKNEGGYCYQTPKGPFFALPRCQKADFDDFAQRLWKHIKWRNRYKFHPKRFFSKPGMGFNQVRISYVFKKKRLNHSCKHL
ncbi:hypothetical protein ACFFWB_27095 [Flavobacterium procerum]|uniref:hypothetical protein n=1 Tax=Flavobacterium procerum TaxID=1455569 RepID=UPI0035E7658E